MLLLLWEQQQGVPLVTQHQQTLIISGLDKIVSKTVLQDNTEIPYHGNVPNVTLLVQLVVQLKYVLHANKITT